MNQNDLTKGSIGKGILVFLLPLLASTLIQQLYNTVDLIFVGKFCGTEATAAVGASSLMITCLIGFFNGMVEIRSINKKGEDYTIYFGKYDN